MHTHTHRGTGHLSPRCAPSDPSLQLEEPGDHPDPYQQPRASAAPPEQEGGQGGPPASPGRVSTGSLPPPSCRGSTLSPRLMQPHSNRATGPGCRQDAAAQAGRAAASTSTLHPWGGCSITPRAAQPSLSTTAASPGCSPFLSPRHSRVSLTLPARWHGQDPRWQCQQWVSALAGGDAATLPGCPRTPGLPPAPHLLRKRPRGRGDV